MVALFVVFWPLVLVLVHAITRTFFRYFNVTSETADDAYEAGGQFFRMCVISLVGFIPVLVVVSTLFYDHGRAGARPGKSTASHAAAFSGFDIRWYEHPWPRCQPFRYLSGCSHGALAA
jgi:hypothetical protein